MGRAAAIAYAREGADVAINYLPAEEPDAKEPSILDITTEDFDATMKTNIYAPFWIFKAALPHMPGGSAIIGTASEQAYDPSADLYDYAQTKAATMNYVKSLAKQLGPKGIRVNGVAIGPIWTPLQVSGGATQEKLKKFGGDTPLGNQVNPLNLLQFMFSLLLMMQVFLPARFMVQVEEAANLNDLTKYGFKRI